MARPTKDVAPPEDDRAAEEGREILSEEDPDLDLFTGDDGSKSPGYLKYPPKPGLPSDADDAGRKTDQYATDEYGRPIIMKDR